MDNADSGKGRLDIITSKNKITVCIEIKYGARAEFKRSQLEFLSTWAGYCGYVKNFEQARRLAADPVIYALTQSQKLKITRWLYRNPDTKRILVSTFEREVFGRALWSE